MCYNAGIEVLNPLGAGFPPAPEVNAMARPVAPVLTMEHTTSFRPMHWLLVPPRISSTTELAGLKIWLANARIEELERKPLFRPLLPTGRCLVRFSWFFEWRHEPSGTKRKFRVFLPDSTPLLLAGLCHATTLDGRHYDSFTVCTMEARGIMRYIHNGKLRQPVVVDEEGAAAWLDPSYPIDRARECVVHGELSHRFESEEMSRPEKTPRRSGRIPGAPG